MPLPRFIRILFLGLLIAPAGNARAGYFMPVVSQRKPEVRVGSGDYVVIVHGWAWLRDSMRPTAKFLNRQGYEVVSILYDARSEMPGQVVEKRISEGVREHCPDPTRKIHFVGHSMGCLMIRDFIARHRPENLGRTVLIAPPNHGIEAVDHVKDWKLFIGIFGEPARLLGTAHEAMAARLGPADFPLGVIMGRDVGLPVVSRMLPGADDGVVAVESGKLAGMDDFTTVRCGHMGLPANSTVLAQTLAFLRDGSFDRTLEEEHKGKARRDRMEAVQVGGR